MTLDAFKCLRAMADHADLFDLVSGQAEAAKAASVILANAIAIADEQKLVLLSRALGHDAFDGLADRMAKPVVSAIIDRIDGSSPKKLSASVALKRLKEIARGKPPLPRLRDVQAMSLDELRDGKRSLGPGFDAWLAKPSNKAQDAVKALDPGHPGISKITAPKARARLTELASGADPVPAFRLAELDVEGLRRARAAVGDGFEAWLMAQKGPDLKAALVRIDPLRPKVKRLAKGEYPSLLLEIAEGGAPVTADDDIEPIGKVRFSMREG